VAEDGMIELGRNQPGELWVRGLNVMKGYWGNKKATEECLTSDGWLKTGDVAYIDDHDKWHIVDRKKVSFSNTCPWDTTNDIIARS
jgi:long-subunit acyl-CoA synthetase (AMP-forming)